MLRGVISRIQMSRARKKNYVAYQMTMYLCTHRARYMRATDIICLYVVRLYTLSSHSVHFMRSELRARAKIFFSYLAPIKKQHISALIQFTMYHSVYNVCCTYYLHILSVVCYYIGIYGGGVVVAVDFRVHRIHQVKQYKICVYLIFYFILYFSFFIFM